MTVDEIDYTTGLPVDVAYNVKATVAQEIFDREIHRYRTLSAQAVDGLNGHTGVVYDETSGERLDVWGIDGAPRPALIVIHGGYWKALSRHDATFMARVMADAGVATVAVDYTLAPRASLQEIVRQVRAAVAWTYRNGADHGLDPEQIFVTGSSAGGHLTGMVMVDGWQARFGLPADVVKGAMPISGLFDLRQLAGSFTDEWAPLDKGRATELSPLLAPVGGGPAIVAVAEHDGIAFLPQSRVFHHAWAQHSVSRLLVVEDRHHYDAFTELADPHARLTRALIDMIHDPASVEAARSPE